VRHPMANGPMMFLKSGGKLRDRL